MKLKFLGTGASEAIPGLFCDCDICTRSMQAGGKKYSYTQSGNC